MSEVKLVRYSDPERKYLAHAAAVYLGKPDIDNLQRPLGIIKKGDTLAIFRGEHARFEFKTSKVVYDHLITYTTQNMRACGGLRANEATVFVPPVEDADPIYEELGNRHLSNYRALVFGIDPQTDDPIKKKRLQAARSIAPMSVELHYMFEFNFATLIEAIFPQRIWTPGAQEDTKEVVYKMWDLVQAQDPNLWAMVHYCYGPAAQAWKKVRTRLEKDNPELYAELLAKYGQMKSMWV